MVNVTHIKKWGDTHMRFSGKTVYVTQANTAQGEALALRFASEGANLVLGSGTEELLGKIEAKAQRA